MALRYQAFQLLRMLKSKHLKCRKKDLLFIEQSLEYELEDSKKPQKGDFLMQCAIDSGRSEFKLIGRVNESGIQLMEWCDDAFNFDYMCPKLEDMQSYKDGIYLKRTYTLEELPKVIDNALSWFNSQKEKNPFRDDQLHIMAVK